MKSAEARSTRSFAYFAGNLDSFALRLQTHRFENAIYLFLLVDGGF